ncbi:MAG: GNAT family N-acetyltransferase [Acidimicrobiales bacterium]|jgi:RimJ/RimL family protein N-acetyltransferase|nr:GNAT family N-acetyltransferase [Acidimicrobiales bacterium]
MDTDVWPLFGLCLRTPRLTLRPVDPSAAFALGDLAHQEGIHDPHVMPFLVPWTDAEPLALRRGTFQFHARCWAEWSVERWHLPFAVWEGDRLVGTQALFAEQFPDRRVVSSGSWVARPAQGQGVGKEMRAAVLHLAFEGLGARRAESGAWSDNVPSIAVSRALGYRENGTAVAMRRGEAGVEQLFVLERSVWEATRRSDIVIEGFEPCREMFGLT